MSSLARPNLEATQAETSCFSSVQGLGIRRAEISRNTLLNPSLPETFFLDWARAKYATASGGQDLWELYYAIDRRYGALVMDPGLAPYANEFEKFARAQPKLHDDPWKMRDDFSDALGTVSVYRTLNLNANELENILRIDGPGMLSQYLLDHPQLRGEDVQYLFARAFLSLITSHNCFSDYNPESPGRLLMSVSTYPDIAVFAGERYRRFKPSSDLYLFKIKIPRIDLIREDPQSALIRPDPLAAGISHDGRYHRPGDILRFVDWQGNIQERRYDSDLESYTYGFITPDEIESFELVPKQ